MENQESIRAEIKRILVDVLDLDIAPEQIRDNDALFGHGLGIDSVEALEILKAIEARLHVQIPEDQIGFAFFQDVASMGDAIESAAKRAQAAPSAPVS